MKNILALLIFCFVSIPAMAYSSYDYASSGSTLGTVTIPAQTGTQIRINDIQVMSDLSSSVLKIYIGAEQGTTTNYTQILQFDVGDTTTSFKSSVGASFLELPVGYQAKVEITSTATNALLVNWKR